MHKICAQEILKKAKEIEMFEIAKNNANYIFDNKIEIN